ncbi:phosphoribosylformylglycinamidine synthase II [Weissella halotolerans DSM 20190]|uniref:Phosphoribosylformylglycinamidine synthase subunit PurL n=1 Tax=Weissella halotolerans DSM 20190 TaxID=1123500 RepID=A0A0R2FYI5_9LACO|nr:phosphoribosylformylglycinamidine synthase II [Weissella halotolerans DSM 20190]
MDHGAANLVDAVLEPSPVEIKKQGLYKQWGLTEDEYEYIVAQIGRLPNYTETGLFAAMWSEHCSYKKSKPVLRTFWSQNERVLQGPGEGAGILDIGDGQAVVFKAESHNHPSAVEPYEGAATGVGGILRDIFSMGAQPIAILDSLRFGEVTQPSTRRLVDGVIAGIAGYGNAIGIPTVGGELVFDKAYQGNPLVNVMAVGLLDQTQMHVGKAEGIGNEVLYVGAKTGRDGIHGATFASAEFDSARGQDRSAVQVGDPFLEKLVMDTTIKVMRELGDSIIGVQDMGAAGLVSSSAEMASKAGNGIELDLDEVPQRETNMTPYELMLSESQERMLLVVKKGQAAKIADYYAKAGLAAVVIGQVRADQRYRLRFKKEIVADVAVDFLTTPPEPVLQQRQPRRLQVVNKQQMQPDLTDASATFLALLGQSSLASKASLYRHFDSMVRTDTVIKPGSDAALVRVAGTKKGLAMTTDINGRYTYLDPKEGGKRAVAEAAANIVVTGAKPIGITDCLNFGNPDDPTIYYELAQSVAGINQMAR